MTSALQELELAYRGLSDEEGETAAEPAEEAGDVEEGEEGFGDDELDPSSEEEEI